MTAGITLLTVKGLTSTARVSRVSSSLGNRRRRTVIKRHVRLGERLVERRVPRDHLLRRNSRGEAVARIKVPGNGVVATRFEDLESGGGDGAERLQGGQAASGSRASRWTRGAHWTEEARLDSDDLHESRLKLRQSVSQDRNEKEERRTRVSWLLSCAGVSVATSRCPHLSRSSAEKRPHCRRRPTCAIL